MRNTGLRACARAFTRVFTRICAPACARAFARVCARVFTRIFTWVCAPACARACALAFALILPPGGVANAQDYPDKLLWGDVHVHSNLSWDAYYGRNETAGVDDAYRFAKGLPVIHPFHRAKVRIGEPLDFLAVTDHAEFLGLPYSLHSAGDERMTSTRLGQHLRSIYARGGTPVEALITMILSFQASSLPAPGADHEDAASRFPPPPPQVSQEVVDWLVANPDMWSEFFNRDVMRSNWELIVETADRHYEPGRFTTLVGWEYSAQANGGNLHRVVLTPVGGELAKRIRPFGFIDGDDPEDLWDYLDRMNDETGAPFVAIPHNSNLSMGGMFARVRFNGEPVDRNYALRRANWETVAEVTQVKGTSETNALLSPDDEFANFEFFNHQLASFKDDFKRPSVTEADYVRAALKTGLELGADLGVNPFKLGMIGSTDSHTALSSIEESDFHGKYGEGSTPEEAGKPIADFNGYTNWELSSSGLAAVWTQDNTREEVFAAFRRREVYGTTGPRIAVRFFGGHAFTDRDARARNLAERGYAGGVPMGGDLPPSSETPRFLIRAVKDARGANLDRVQVVKGWLDAAGDTHEKVFNVAWSDDRELNDDGSLPAVGDTVDRETASYTNDIGAPELAGVWRDPEFDPAQPAFYYLRVLEIPTPRHSLFDAVALKTAHPEGLPEVIRERAYSSPIWYTPGE